MREVEMAHRFSDVSRLLDIKTSRLAFTDGTKTAMARADVSAQHECRGPVRPAFEDVWATGLLTDGVQVQALNQFQNIVLIGWIAKPNL